jgi:hypothetical protein
MFESARERGLGPRVRCSDPKIRCSGPFTRDLPLLSWLPARNSLLARYQEPAVLLRIHSGQLASDAGRRPPVPPRWCYSSRSASLPRRWTLHPWGRTHSADLVRGVVHPAERAVLSIASSGTMKSAVGTRVGAGNRCDTRAAIHGTEPAHGKIHCRQRWGLIERDVQELAVCRPRRTDRQSPARSTSSQRPRRSLLIRERSVAFPFTDSREGQDDGSSQTQCQARCRDSGGRFSASTIRRCATLERDGLQPSNAPSPSTVLKRTSVLRNRSGDRCITHTERKPRDDPPGHERSMKGWL